jgi:hypothetical protein
MSFLQSLFSILSGFLGSYLHSLEAQVSNLSIWMGNQFASLFMVWGASFQGYGIWIPGLFVLVTGISLIGLFAVFTFFDGAKDLVGGD